MKNGTRAFVGLGILAAIGATLYAAVTTTIPHLAFFGNTTAYGISKSDAAILLRQPDCSLELITFYPAKIPHITANFQTTLHQLAGLTTQANVFAHGCDDPVLGISADGDTYVGKNADGTYEAVEAAHSGNDLVVYISNPSTLTFRSTVLATNVLPQVRAVDLNNDGHADIVAAGVTDATSHQTGIGVFISNGDGTYKPGVVYPVASDSFVIEDLNNDGKPDILVMSSGAGSPRLVSFLNRGDGSFTAGAISPTLAGGKIITGDVNGDGKKDVVSSTGAVYLGHGDGSFAAGTQGATVGFSVTALALGDFDGDGKADLAVLEGPIVIHHGNGDGSFTRGETYAATSGAAALVATDLDGDGNVDLMVARSGAGEFGPAADWRWQALMGRGDGTFAAPSVTLARVNGGSSVLANTSSEAAGDFDGDGKPDLVFPIPATGGATYTAGFAKGRGDGTFAAPQLIPMNISLYAVSASDLNADGKLDLIGVGTQGSSQAISVLLGNGDGTFGGEQDYVLPVSVDLPTNIVVGDFNGDGFKDLAVAYDFSATCTCATGVYVLLGKSDHTFQAPQLVDSSKRPWISAGDANGDGRSDLLIADAGLFGATPTPGTLRLYAGNADGSFTSSSISTSSLYFGQVALADVNHDGKLDIVATATAGGPGGANEIAVLLGAGNGTFGMAIETKIISSAGDQQPVFALMDHDGDGKLDVAFALPGDFAGMLYGNGDGTFSRQTNMIVAPYGPTTPIALDLNGDGRTDLLVGDASAEGIISYINQTGQLPVTGATSTSTALTSTPNPAVVGQSVTLTATVSGSGGTPTGAVAFMDGNAPLGTASLTAGQASLSIATLTAGSHSLTAEYGGDTTFASSASSPLIETITSAAGGDFAITLNPASATIGAGQSATATLTLTPSGNPTGTVSLSCSGLPNGTACEFSPATLSASASGTSTLTISSTARSVAALPGGATGMGLGILGGHPTLASAVTGSAPPLLLLALMLPLACFLRGTPARPALRYLLLGGFATVALSACHDNHSTAPPGGTPSGTYTVTVTATDGSLHHDVTLTLTVS